MVRGCLGLAATRDHIFAREFFRLADRNNLPIVPACKRCNERKSQLEHYLTSVLPFGATYAGAADAAMNSVTRRFPKNQKVSRQFLTTLRPAWIREGSLFLQTATFKFDSAKLAALLKMIARGLAWHHWQCFVGPEYYSDVLFIPDVLTLDFQDRVRRWPSGRRISVNIGDGTIRYDSVQTTDPPELTVGVFPSSVELQ